MNIVIFGATGRTGRWLVDQALDAGYDVTAFVRETSRLERQHSRLRVLEGDVQDAAAVSRAVEDQDTVLSALGHNRERPSIDTLLSSSARNILAAMEIHNVRRLIFLAGAGVAYPKDQRYFGSIFIIPLIKLLAGNVFYDAEQAVEQIRISNVEWTIVRVPRLSDDPPGGELRAGYEKPGPRPISRADAARFMLDQLTDGHFIHEAPIISYERMDT